MEQTISILHAGEQATDAIAFQIYGKLLERVSEDKINNYKVDDVADDEMSYLDKVSTYIKKVVSNDKIIIIISEKYLTKSIACQEEIHAIVGKFEDNFRGNVFIIYADNKVENNIKNIAGESKILTTAHNFIVNVENNLSKSAHFNDAKLKLQAYPLSIKIFLDVLKDKRGYTYKKDEIDKLVNDITQGTSVQKDENNSKVLEEFLSMFNACFPDETFEEYGEYLKIMQNLDNDSRTINDIYKKCMLPESSNINIVDLANNTANKSDNINLKEDTNEYIATIFYKKYYFIPAAIKYELLPNGEKGEGFDLDDGAFIDKVKDDFDDGKLIYLIGGVGEGKSTFIKKMILDLSIENESDKYNLVYYKFNGEDTIDKIFNNLNVEIEKEKKNLLFIDELDSFSHIYERFMFTADGYMSFKEQIKKTKEIIERLKRLLQKNEIQSIFVSVRPYVLSHFKKRTLINLNGSGSIYELKYPDDAGEKIMRKRIELFKKIIHDIQDSSMVRKGTKDAFEKYKNEIIAEIDKKLFEVLPNGNKREHIIQLGNKNIYVPIPKKHEPINKLLKLSTHGFRTLITLYHDLGYNPKLYQKYFTNTIFLFYVLGLYKKYCQILPQRYNNNPSENYTGKVYNYPNMYLSIASSETNKNIACAIPHTITYWLKIFLLDFINRNKNITIDKILEEFNNFDRGLVLIALGSLGTINEYNCIEYDFPTSQYDNLENFIARTKAKLTRRGEEIITNDRYMDYNNLEFFVDDWQLPKPKIEVILGETYKDRSFYEKLKVITEQNFTYEHLEEEDNDSFSFKDFILNKARLVIWYTYIFEVALKKEMEYYRITFFEREKTFFEEKRKRIQSEVNAIYRAHYPNATIDLRNELRIFNTQCAGAKNLIESFFDTVFEKEIKASCFRC